MLFFRLIPALLWLFVVLRFLAPLPLGAEVMVAVSVVLFLGSQHHVLSRRLFGFSTEAPRVFGMIANVLFGTLLLLATFQTALDLLVLLSCLVKGSYLAPPLVARYVLGAAALALSIYGVSQATRVPPVKEMEIALAGLPPEFDGYRIAQLTDLHLSGLFGAGWAKAVVDKTNLQDVDLIVITGDLMDGTLEARKNDVEPLRALRAKDGVFVIPGNHEYYFGYEGWMRKYQELGMRRLANSHVQLKRASSSLVLAGITDSASTRFGLPRPNLGEALEGAPSEAPVILLAHQPKGASTAAEAGVALQLSGHTHGGMVVGLDRLIARFNRGFVSGLYKVGKMQLYVNNGTALWNGFALRIGVPSELTVITLRQSLSTKD